MNNQALPEFQQTLAINNTFQKANYAMGTIYLKQGDISDARASFQKELELNPNSPDVQKQLIPFSDIGKDILAL